MTGGCPHPDMWQDPSVCPAPCGLHHTRCGLCHAPLQPCPWETKQVSTARTPSQRGKANRNRGARAELDVVRYLRGVGFPQAERAVVTGYRTADRTRQDPGDITGVPGLVISVKDAEVERLTPWMAEVDDMVNGARADFGILIHKRRGHADPARWWCWIQLGELYTNFVAGGGFPIADAYTHPVRMELGHMIPILHHLGYGTPAEEVAS